MSKLESIEKDKDVLYALKNKLKEMRAVHGMNTQQLLEEKRKIDEEEKLIQGRVTKMTRVSGSQRNKSVCKCIIFIIIEIKYIR